MTGVCTRAYIFISIIYISKKINSGKISHSLYEYISVKNIHKLMNNMKLTAGI